MKPAAWPALLLTLAAASVAAITLSALSACRGGAEGLTQIELRRAGGGRATLRVEVADTPEELQKGLSGRSELANDRGMLFVIEKRGPGFWMKDVGFPLSVAFITRCGEIIDIQDMEPNSLFFHDTPGEFRFGLEANKGWFGGNGVRVGDRVVLPGSLRSRDCAA